jgi:phage-related protein
MSTFTWPVDSNATVSKKPRVNNIKFGDGYEQRTSYGLNTNLQNWDLSFANREETEANEIDDFLTARGGVESFDWTPPGELLQENSSARNGIKLLAKEAFIL